MTKSWFSLNDTVTVVVGGAGLLGQAFTEGLATMGSRVVIADIDARRAEEIATEVSGRLANSQVTSIGLDMTSPQSVADAVSQIDKSHGRIDALVNNAYPRNSRYGSDFFAVEYDSFCENVSINLGGCFLASKTFGEYFYRQGWGNIVNIASIYGTLAPRFEVYDDTEMTMPVEYAVIKAGLIQLTRYLAKYFKGHKIRVNSLSPGGILNQQDASFVNAYNQYSLNKGMLDPQDIVGALVFLLSDQSTYINGQNLIVDDGFTL